MPLILIYITLASFLLLAVGFQSRRNRRPLSRGDAGAQPERKISYNPHAELPLSERKRTLKVCPDCRELVVLDARSC